MKLTTPPLNPNAINADFIIEILREELLTLVSLNLVVLPRAIPKQRVGLKGRVVKFPIIEQYKAISGTYDNLSLEPIEKTNFCFFGYDKEREDSEGRLIVTNLSCIFYFDLRTIQSNEDIKAKVKQDLQSIFNKVYPFELQVTEIVDNDFDSVWAGYKLPDLEMVYFSYPFYTLRFSFPEVIGQYKCSPLNSYNKNLC
jgi:hypothetical protein